jgi:hypothetical protein
MTTYNVINPAALSAGQPEDISVVLANLQAIAAVVNGSLDDANLSPAANISPSKLLGYPADVAKVLKGNGSWGTLADTPTATYGTALPATPADGREHILVDSTTNPTWQWRFRYNAGSSSSYKWEYLGGSPFIHAIETLENGAAVGPADLATVGPQWTCPINGEYIVEMSARANKFGNTDWYVAQIQLQDNGVAVSPDIAPLASLYGIGANTPAPWARLYDRGKLTVLATHVIKALYWIPSYGTGGGNFGWQNRRLTVTPVRVAG